jgi:hypothetical protein
LRTARRDPGKNAGSPVNVICAQHLTDTLQRLVQATHRLVWLGHEEFDPSAVGRRSQKAIASSGEAGNLRNPIHSGRPRAARRRSSRPCPHFAGPLQDLKGRKSPELQRLPLFSHAREWNSVREHQHHHFEDTSESFESQLQLPFVADTDAPREGQLGQGSGRLALEVQLLIRVAPGVRARLRVCVLLGAARALPGNPPLSAWLQRQGQDRRQRTAMFRILARQTRTCARRTLPNGWQSKWRRR